MSRAMLFLLEALVKAPHALADFVKHTRLQVDELFVTRPSVGVGRDWATGVPRAAGEPEDHRVPRELSPWFWPRVLQ